MVRLSLVRENIDVFLFDVDIFAQGYRVIKSIALIPNSF